MGETNGNPRCVTFSHAPRQNPPGRENYQVSHPLRAGSLRAGVLAMLCTLLAGCATGAVRQTRVVPLAPYGDVRAVRVVASEPESTMARELVSGARAGLPKAGWRLANDNEPAYTLELHIAEAQTPVTAEPSLQDSVMGGLATFGGFRDEERGLLAVDATLRAPETGQMLGGSRWQAVGRPTSMAGGAGLDLGQAFGKAMQLQRDEWYPRRGADERLFFTPTARTLPNGAFAISDDEALLFRAAYGLSRRWQIDAWLGGIPVPAVGGAVLPLPGAILAAGGGGGALFGLFDLGVKFVALDETNKFPGIAISYDLLDVFGAAIGGAGGVGIGGGGAGGVGFVGTGGTNAQFNLLTLVAGKHFETGTQVTLGGWLLDNHAFLPQKTSFVAACVGAGTSGNTSGAGIIPCSGSTPTPHLPVQLQGFFAVEQVFSEHWSAAVEVMPTYPIASTKWTTGVRWLPSGDAPAGFVALDRIKARVDFALVWMILDADPQAGRDHATPVYFPWVGVGLYVW
jgi:hypothetical protein